MYEQQTKQAILQRMLDTSPSDIDKRQGSVTFDLLSPAAIELAQVYIELDNVLKFGFASPEQPSPFLDLRAGEFGITRRPSMKAEGMLVFGGSDGTVVPQGIIVTTDDPDVIWFETATSATIEGGVATVLAIAAEGGRRGNVATGRIKLVTGDLSGIVSVSNLEAFKGGADTESDESLLLRYFDRVRTPATSGNVWHYRQWALEVPGVGDVKVFPIWNGNGTVKLAILSDDKRAPSDTTVQQVYQYVEERRPVGALVTVSPAIEVSINVTANLSLKPGVTTESVKSRFELELASYLADLAFTEPVVRYNRIAGLLLNMDAVVDFTNLQLNLSAGNITISDDQVAVAGTVKFIEA